MIVTLHFRVEKKMPDDGQNRGRNRNRGGGGRGERVKGGPATGPNANPD